MIISCRFNLLNVLNNTILHVFLCDKWPYCILNRAVRTRIIQDAGRYRVCHWYRRRWNNYHRRDWELLDVVRDNSLRPVAWCDRDVPCESRSGRSSSDDVWNASDSCFSISQSVDIWRGFVHDQRTNELSVLYHVRADAHCSLGWSMAGDLLSTQVPYQAYSR